MFRLSGCHMMHVAAQPASELLALTQREIETLELLDRFTFLTAEHLQELLLSHDVLTDESRRQTPYRVLHTLKAKELVAETERLIGGKGSTPAANYLTRKGRRAVFDPVRGGQSSNERSIRQLQHELNVATGASALTRRARLTPDHELITLETRWEAAYRFGQDTVVPDLFYIYDTPTMVLSPFMEFEIANSTEAYKKKVRKYVRFFKSMAWKVLGVPPLIQTVTQTSRRATHLAQACEIVDPPKEMEFAYTSIDAFAEDPLGDIWRVAGKDGHHSVLEHGDQLPDQSATDPLVNGISAEESTPPPTREAVTTELAP